jgi:ABC-type multidrug transport system fused ATPase/permease subunit
VVIITHDEQIARLPSRLVVIDDGLVVFDGSPDERA